MFPATRLLLRLNYDWQTQYGALAGWQMLYHDPQSASFDEHSDTAFLSKYVEMEITGKQKPTLTATSQTRLAHPRSFSFLRDPCPSPPKLRSSLSLLVTGHWSLPTPRPCSALRAVPVLYFWVAISHRRRREMSYRPPRKTSRSKSGSMRGPSRPINVRNAPGAPRPRKSIT